VDHPESGHAKQTFYLFIFFLLRDVIIRSAIFYWNYYTDNNNYNNKMQEVHDEDSIWYNIITILHRS